jgi:hypothetical protein
MANHRPRQAPVRTPPVAPASGRARDSIRPGSQSGFDAAPQIVERTELVAQQLAHLGRRLGDGDRVPIRGLKRERGRIARKPGASAVRCPVATSRVITTGILGANANEGRERQDVCRYD